MPNKQPQMAPMLYLTNTTPIIKPEHTEQTAQTQSAKQLRSTNQPPPILVHTYPRSCALFVHRVLSQELSTRNNDGEMRFTSYAHSERERIVWESCRRVFVSVPCATGFNDPHSSMSSSYSHIVMTSM